MTDQGQQADIRPELTISLKLAVSIVLAVAAGGLAVTKYWSSQIDSLKAAQELSAKEMKRTQKEQNDALMDRLAQIDRRLWTFEVATSDRWHGSDMIELTFRNAEVLNKWAEQFKLEDGQERFKPITLYDPRKVLNRDR